MFITDYEKNISSIGSNQFPETNVSLNVQALGPNNLVRIEHNWVKPDGFRFQNPGIRISDYHYWKVDGAFDNSFVSKATFIYDGRTPAAATASIGYIDNTLITVTEDSLVLLYRSGTADEWRVINSTINYIGSHTDKYGNMTVDTLRKGEYVFGYRDYILSGSSELVANKLSLKAFPNPAENICQLEFYLPPGKNGLISAYDSSGKLVYSTTVFSHQTFIFWNCHNIAAGNYVVSLTVNDATVTEKIVLTKK